MLTMTFFGHATCLLQCGGRAVLTDPHFGLRLGWMRRRQDCRALAAQLPELDAVVISHTHPDHLDVKSFKYLRSRIPVILPTRCAGPLLELVNNPLVELAHWVPHTPAPDVAITAVPVRHFGGRLVPGLRYTTVNGYLIQLGGRTIYFAGDSSYGTHFREVGNLATIDLAVLPVGGTWPAVPGLPRPMSALEVIQATLDLKAAAVVPIHWGAFGWRRAADLHVARLKSLAAERGLTSTLHVIEPGDTATIPPPGTATPGQVA